MQQEVLLSAHRFILLVIENCPNSHTNREKFTIFRMSLPQKLIASDPIHSSHLVHPFLHGTLLTFHLREAGRFDDFSFFNQASVHMFSKGARDESHLTPLLIDCRISLADPTLLDQ